MKILRMMIVITVIVMSMGAKCEVSDPGFSDPNPPGQPRDRVTKGVDTNPNDPDPKKMIFNVEIEVFVDAEHSPYEIEIFARDLTTGRGEMGGGPVSAGRYRSTLSYNTGAQIHIRLEVKPGKAGSLQAYCRLQDGLMNRTQVYVDGGWRAICELTTKR